MWPTEMSSSSSSTYSELYSSGNLLRNTLSGNLQRGASVRESSMEHSALTPLTGRLAAYAD